MCYFFAEKSVTNFFQEENRRSLAENNVDKLQKEAERYKGTVVTLVKLNGSAVGLLMDLKKLKQYIVCLCVCFLFILLSFSVYMGFVPDIKNTYIHT